ncbi:ROK family protein [Luteolibacter pohnpeiensis]|uniref:ROK family protein n=1 Tax=Luteolibacter pohnpeiensis TaxID=454153 RepID=A0A934VV85_9BACT|nr:ROK family protein [Luteolibacter pohnpeiensis]MBK1883312.1 ROK family protein [Luteolibacter pohnpeiensis]
MSETPLAIGIDFGGTSVKAGVVKLDTIIDHAPPIATQDFTEPAGLIEAIVRVIEDLRARHPGIVAVGVGMPGFVDFENGVVYNLTNVRGWVNIPLKSLLEEKTGLPVVVDNDANCMAFAEWKRGAGQGTKHLVCISLGTGVGGGIIANGQMVRGAYHGAGEVGQTSIDYQGRRGHYGNMGALEDYIGNNEITATAHDTYGESGTSKPLDECSPAALAAAAAEGDETAKQLWDDIGKKLATAVMNCCWLLNPEAVVIGGGVARAGALLFEPLNKYLLDQLSGPFKDHLKILPARFGHEAGTVGAAAMALEWSDHHHS